MSVVGLKGCLALQIYKKIKRILFKSINSLQNSYLKIYIVIYDPNKAIFA